jgi:hypothetical protein
MTAVAMRRVCATSMLCVLCVLCGEAPQAQAQQPDLTLTLQDHNYKLTAPIRAGKSTWLVRNTGTERHQALVVRLPDRVSEFAVRNWITNGSHGDPPGEPMAKVDLDAGKETRVQVDLSPGRYILLCGMKEDEGFHFDLGMIYRFTIE